MSGYIYAYKVLLDLYDDSPHDRRSSPDVTWQLIYLAYKLSILEKEDTDARPNP